MKYMLLAVHKDYIPDEVIVGYRIYDTETKSIADVTTEQVFNAIRQGNEIDGISVVDGVIKGSNGALDRYTTLINGQSFGSCPIIVTKEFPGEIYEVVNYLGKNTKMKLENIITYANSEGLANVKVVTRDNKQFISRISGEIEKDKMFDDLKAGDGTRRKMTILNVKTYKMDDDNMAYCDNKEINTEELQIGRGCLGIRPNGFSNTGIKSLVLPNTCTLLGVRCFANMKNLTKIVLPEGIEAIPSFAFDGCSSLEEIDLPNSCIKINSNAFRNCNKLRVIRTGPRKPNIEYGAVPPRTKLLPRR